MDDTFVEALRRELGKKPQVLPAADGLEPMAFVPGDYTLKSLAEFRTTLDRVRQAVQVQTAQSFVDYWNRFAHADSVIFADEIKGCYVGFVDYHTSANEPRFCQHMVTYQVRNSLEWETWTGADGKSMPQADFARFLEENYVDIVDPPHADMIAVATNLKAKKAVEFASAVDLQTGEVQFLYQESIRGSADKRQGSIKIPEAFTIGVPVLLGDERVAVKALFRYRIEEGKLRLWYDLHRRQQHWEAAIRRATAAIRKDLPDAPFFLGSAR